MATTTPRRRFLLALGGTAALAGCVGPVEDVRLGDLLGSNRSVSDTGVTRGYPAMETGELVDAFTDESRWGVSVGEMTMDEDVWLRGEQTLSVSSGEDGTSAGLFVSFPDGLDLAGNHLSLAVKLASAGSVRVTSTVLAPGRSDHLETSRRIGRDFDDWLRIDLGYTSRRGEPNLSSVQELRIGVQSLDDEPVTMWMDDLRSVPGDETGKAVLVFHNGRESYYDWVYPELEERGISAVAPVGYHLLNASGRLSVQQARTLRDAGWDIASRPDVSDPLPSMSEEDQREVIVSTRDYLHQRGFPDGCRHFFAPGYSMDNTTVDIVREAHDSGFTFGGCPNATPPVGRHAGSIFNGDAGDSSRRLIELAGAYGQTAVLGFSGIGPEHNLDVEGLLSLVDFIEAQGLEIVTLSELFG